MRKAIDILNEQINECDLKFTQKERLAIVYCISQAQKDAIEETIEKSCDIVIFDGQVKELQQLKIRLKEQL